MSEHSAEKDAGRDELAVVLHQTCGYEHGGYDGPCGHLADILLSDVIPPGLTQGGAA